MTVKELKQILTVNNIPEDARLMSDSGWECCATDMDGVYYNPKENIIVFTQEEDYSDYCKKPEWVKLYAKSEEENELVKTFIITFATDTKEQMREMKEYLSMMYGAEEQKSGRWIDVRLSDYVLVHRCSNCLHCSDKASNYCPNCGAKMEVKDDK